MAHERAHQNATAPGIVHQHTLRGEPVQGVGGVNHAQGSVQLAGLHSTAPYKPPKRRKRDNPDVQLCSYEDCKAYPMKSTGYCAGHSKKLNLVDWPKGGRVARKEINDDSDGAEETRLAADGDDRG